MSLNIKREIIINGKFLGERPSGVGRYAIELSKELITLNPDIKIVSPREVYDSHLADVILKVVRVGKGKGVVWEQYELRKYLLSFSKKPFLINLTGTAPLFYGNSIITIHDVAFYHNPKWYSKGAYFYLSNLNTLMAFSNPKHFVTVSNFSRTEITKYLKIPPNKISVIYNSTYDSGEIVIQSKLIQFIESPYLLYVGNLDPRKNLQSLILAFAKGDFKNLKLVIAGAGHKTFSDLSFDIPQHIEKQIMFIGYVSDNDLVWLYQNASLLVYPSLYEGFGIPPLEAMRYSCPTLVSDIAVFHEVYGDCTVYCDSKDPIDIEKKINLILSDIVLINSLKAKGCKKANEFSWKDSAVKLLNLIYLKLPS